MPRKRAASRSPEQTTKPNNKHARAGTNAEVLSASSLRAARASAGQRTPSTRATRGAAMVQHANPDFAPPKNTPKPARVPAPSTSVPAPSTSVHTPSMNHATNPTNAVAMHTPNKTIPTASACLTSNAKALLRVPLPEPYTALIQVFGALQTYHDLCRRRGQRCHWHAAQAAIEESTKRRTTTKHLLQLQALCPDACTLSWTRTPPPAEGGRPQWALVVMLHDQGGAPHAAQGITSPRSPSARLSRCQTQQLQQAQLRTRLALLVLEELHARHGSSEQPTTTTTHDTAACITQALAAGACAADVVDTIRSAADAQATTTDIYRLEALLQHHHNTWPWCPPLPEAPLPVQPASPSRSSQLPATPLCTPATTGQPLASTGRSRLATQIKEFARVRRLSFGGGGGIGKEVGKRCAGGVDGGVEQSGHVKQCDGSEEHHQHNGNQENNTQHKNNNSNDENAAIGNNKDDGDDDGDDASVLASLPTALRRRSMDGTLPIALSTIKAMRAREAEHSTTNSPAAIAQRTQQATHALLPRVFDCIRLLYANEPRAKPLHVVTNAVGRIDGVDGSGVDAQQLLQALAAALPEWLTLSTLKGQGGAGGTMVVVKAHGVDHGALRGKLVRMAGPRRRLSLGASPRPAMLPNVRMCA